MSPTRARDAWRVRREGKKVNREQGTGNSILLGPSGIAVRLALLSLFTVSCSLFTFSQRVEHYNSPLYSPKYYDPAESEANSGLPSALKTVGIEQKLGNQLPLDTVLKNEDGRDVKLDEYFKSGRPV